MEQANNKIEMCSTGNMWGSQAYDYTLLVFRFNNLSLFVWQKLYKNY